MNERVSRLRRLSYDAPVTLSAERAELVTDFYRENIGKYPVPVMRGLVFEHLCRHKTMYIGPDELIVGERGPKPKAVPTYPELTCHSEEDLRILDTRPVTRYAVGDDVTAVYRDKI
ncbi:MAG: pyruvate formate lyase family protein, partial [bacterium]